MSRAVI